jgi:two-component system LytT family response regulator
MTFLAVDDEKLALCALTDALRASAPEAEVVSFRSAAEALDWARTAPFDAAFLDIEMREMNGLALAKELKDLSADANIVFVTGYTEYALDAMNLFASAYLLKPVTPDKIQRALANLRHPVAAAEHPERLRVQCFGKFEVFSGGKPLAFSRSRSKELLAFLVDRCGAGSTMPEIADALWEDGQYGVSRRNQIHAFLSDLTRTLEGAGAKDVLLRQYNSYAVDTARLDCDFYRCLQNDPAAINAYHGEYMSQYPWAELTTGSLTQKLL